MYLCLLERLYVDFVWVYRKVCIDMRLETTEVLFGTSLRYDVVIATLKEGHQIAEVGESPPKVEGGFFPA